MSTSGESGVGLTGSGGRRGLSLTPREEAAPTCSDEPLLPSRPGTGPRRDMADTTPILRRTNNRFRPDLSREIPSKAFLMHSPGADARAAECAAAFLPERTRILGRLRSAPFSAGVRSRPAVSGPRPARCGAAHRSDRSGPPRTRARAPCTSRHPLSRVRAPPSPHSRTPPDVGRQDAGPARSLAMTPSARSHLVPMERVPAGGTRRGNAPGSRPTGLPTSGRTAPQIRTEPSRLE